MNNFSRELKAILTAAGYRLARSGKGDHEIWQHETSGKRVTVDGAIKSRHTANAVLKQAGLPKAF